MNLTTTCEVLKQDEPAPGPAQDRYRPLQSSAPFDPLDASVGLPFAERFFPLGFPVTISSNDPEVLNQGRLSWGHSQKQCGQAAAELRVLVTETSCPVDLRPPAFRAQRNLMVAISDVDHFGTCELGGDFGFITTSRALLQHDDFFRYHFLEGLIYSLLDTRNLATIHSACVSWKGRGVLLIGESGAGKSSFAYGCARRGWTYTSDDASSLLLSSTGRTVRGNPNGFRFRPSIAVLFPELSGHVRDRNGKPTLEIRTALMSGVQCSQESTIDYVIFLDRRPTSVETPTLASVAKSELYRRLSQTPWPAELPTTDARRNAIARLSSAGGFELRYSELDSAIDALERLVS